LALFQTWQELLLEPAAVPVDPTRDHECRGKAFGLGQVFKLIARRADEAPIAEGLQRGVLIHPFLAVLPIAEHAKGKDRAPELAFHSRIDENAVRVRLGFQELGHLPHGRRLASLARHDATDRDVEFLDPPLPRAVYQEVADDGSTAVPFQNFPAHPVSGQAVHFVAVSLKGLDQVTTDKAGPAGNDDFKRHAHRVTLRSFVQREDPLQRLGRGRPWRRSTEQA